MPCGIETSQQFLLFRVHADHWLSGIKILLLQLGDLFKLGVAVSVLAHRPLLLRLEATQLLPSCGRRFFRWRFRSSTVGGFSISAFPS